MAESETPRTNYAAGLVRFVTTRDDYEMVSADFSRQLECELLLKDQKIAELERVLRDTYEAATDAVGNDLLPPALMNRILAAQSGESA